MRGTEQPAPEAYEEWRLVYDVPLRLDGLDVVVRDARAVAPPHVDIRRRDRGDIAVYALSEHAMQDARAVVEQGLRMFGIPFTPELKRWNPGAERWQDPALPVEPPRSRLGPEWLELDELAWEVRLRLPSRREMVALATSLSDDGAAVITDGWRRLTVGVADERAARSLANDLRLRSGAFTTIEVRPLSRWRRWLIRQRLLGGYGEGGGGDWGGDGGGGGNGGGG